MYPYGPYPDDDGSWWSHTSEGPAATTDLLDEILARRVADQLLEDPQIRNGRVVVAVQNRVVILEGRMDSCEACEAAGRQAWATSGVHDVLNRLTASHG
jgi:osmotically-inducible protein OsmY